MQKNKIAAEFTVEADQRAWLESMAAEHHLADESKALRVLLDFAMEEGDKALIFEQIRCARCG